MGEVYQARDTRLGRLVAIKFVSDEFAADRTASERLVREAKLTSLLNHPNIVTVHDVGDMNGRPFIVMELVVGQSLYAALQEERLKPARAIRDRQPDCRWPGSRARRRHRAPRSEAAQHHADRGRPREDRRLRRRQDEHGGDGHRRSDVRGRPDGDVRRRRHGRLHGPGAGDRQVRRFPRGSIRPRHAHLRDDHRPARIQARHLRADDGGDCRGRAGADRRADSRTLRPSS